uniref:Uncharacterized protein n=1 Tax=Romanomermis culicivorax TaxID=13658 RepID=A0A915I867_ROMCU
MHTLPEFFAASIEAVALLGFLGVNKALFARLQTISNFTHPCPSRPDSKKAVLLLWECEYSRGEPPKGLGAHP